MAKDGGAADPLRNPRFQEPSVWQLFRESLFGKPRLLDCIQVEVTSVCPGRCVYCPHTTQAGYWRSRHMEAATFARLWPLMQESGRVHLQGWGEPFLHPRFMDFAALARKAGCRVSTTTCGLRMDETLAGQIVGSGIDIVAFSLVGTDEASNAPRAGVPFSRVREAVRPASFRADDPLSLLPFRGPMERSSPGVSAVCRCGDCLRGDGGDFDGRSCGGTAAAGRHRKPDRNINWEMSTRP